MDINSLKKIVRQGEGLRTEFKLKADFPEKIVKEIVAFANTEGGVLIIGVSDQKEMVGLRYPEEEKYALCRAIDECCTPKISYQTELIPIPGNEGRDLLIFYVPKSSDAPHCVLTHDHDPIIYVRSKDKCIQASKEVRTILKEKRKHKNYTFEFGEKEKLLMEYLEDFSFITLSKFVEIAEIDQKAASRTLILLVLSNVLIIQPDENEDRYVRAFFY